MSTGRTYLFPVRPDWQTVESEFIDVTHLVDNKTTLEVLREAALRGLVSSTEYPYRFMRVSDAGIPEWLSSAVKLEKQTTVTWTTRTITI